MFSGTTLWKASGCDGCPDAGAISTQQLLSGDGAVEFTATATNALRYIGLGNGNAGTNGSDIAFALRFQNGYAEVRERGVYRSDVRASSGDVFRVAVTGGKVTYARNGSVFYTSQVIPTYPLLVDTGFNGLGGSFDSVTVAFGGSTVSAPAPTAPVVAGTAAIGWTKFVNTALATADLRKTAGCDGCPDAGAIGSTPLTRNGQSVSITVGQSPALRFLGLSSVNRFRSPNQLPFSLRLENGYLEVREGGVYRWDKSIVPGDVLTIALVNNVVEYSKNGEVFYRNPNVRVGTAYYVHGVLFQRNALLGAVTLSGF
jgi:hypothetical protein